MNLLILGATGMLGHKLMQVLSQNIPSQERYGGIHLILWITRSFRK